MASEVVSDPLAASKWRKWLALRVMALNLLSLVLAGWVLGVVDEADLDLPSWVGLVIGLPFIAVLFGFIANLSLGVADLVAPLRKVI